MKYLMIRPMNARIAVIAPRYAYRESIFFLASHTIASTGKSWIIFTDYVKQNKVFYIKHGDATVE